MTKARTKAARRGRQRKSGAREPNGRLQRDPLAESIAETRSTNIQARMAMHGLTLIQAGEALAGYEIGRMYLRGQITKGDADICDDYVKVVARYMQLTSPGRPFPKAMDYLQAKGFGAEPPQETIDAIRKAYTRWLKPLTGEGSTIVQHVMAFHDVAFFDNPVGGRVTSIKACAAALRKEFGREDAEEKK